MLTDSLYAKYIGERKGARILEDEFSFVAYSIRRDELFISEMYVSPEKRGTGHGRKVIERLVDLGKDSQCRNITANVWVKDDGASNTILAALRVGFEVVSAEAGVLLIVKRIGGD